MRSVHMAHAVGSCVCAKSTKCPQQAMRKLLFLLLVATASAQTVPVTGHLADGSGNTYTTGFLRFQLWNCGSDFPIWSGHSITVVQQQFDLHPNLSTGLISGSVIPNDQILCGRVASTQWIVTPMKDSVTPLQPSQRYYIQTAGGTFDISTAQPTTINPPLPGFILVFQNPLVSQAINQPAGTTMTFSGAFKFGPVSTFSVPVFAGATTTANGGLAYDSTANHLHTAVNGVDQLICTTAGECGAGGGGTANQSVSFTSVLSATLTATSTKPNITWSCWDNQNPANAIFPSNVTINTTTQLVTFKFLTPQSGFCAVNSNGGSATQLYSASETGGTWSIPAATHQLGASVIVATYDASGNQVFGNVVVDNSGNVTVSWLSSQTGKVVITP